MQATATAKTLKDEVIKMLHKQGYAFQDNAFYVRDHDGANIRNMHTLSRAERINQHIDFIKSFMPQAQQLMRDHAEIEISKIRPVLIEVQPCSMHSKLFLWWNLTWWSLPYEKAYGRQMRFIVWDEYHQAPIGLIGLQSPILRWNVRDQYLGITKDMRDFWINQSMSAQRLGALPPYNKFLGGKLVALLASSDLIRTSYRNKYKDYETVIMNRKIPANLLFITTTGAYGKSSVYNRLRFDEKKVCDFIGYTNGSGSFHIPNTLYEGFANYLAENGIKAGRAFGNGPSVKMKIIDCAMKLLGFKNGTSHGIRRAVYLFPLVQNLKEVIHCNKDPVEETRSIEDLTKYWKERWAIKRMKGYQQEKLKFSKEEFLSEMKQDLENCKKLVAENLP